MEERKVVRSAICDSFRENFRPGPMVDDRQMPNSVVPHPVEFAPATNGLEISQPNRPFYRRVGRRFLRLVRPLALPLLARLQARVSSGVDASFSAQVLRQMLSVQRAIDARLATMEKNMIKVLKGNVDGPIDDRSQELSASAVECSSKLRQTGGVALGEEVPACSPVVRTSAALALLLSHCHERFTLVDVGARWGAHDRWGPLGDVADIVGFEPDREECERLEASKAPNTRYLPVGLSDTGGVRDLFVAVEPACSSNFEPVPALYQHYPSLANIRPLRKIEMLCRRLDDVLAEQGVDRVAALKLDTQGSELSILQGAERTLSTCSLIDVEVEFNPIYQRQALFCDVDQFLRDRGFVLWRFENLVHYSTESLTAAEAIMTIAGYPTQPTVARVPNGQLFWAQAQYIRREYPRTGVDYMEFSEAIVPAILAGTYGWWDLALELVRKSGNPALSYALRATLAH